MDGLTGPIKFDARGFRTDFNMDIIELKQEGLVKVGFKFNWLMQMSKVKLCIATNAIEFVISNNCFYRSEDGI